MFSFENNKKMFQIAGFLLAALFFGFLIYYFFFRPITPAPATTPTASSTPSGRLPGAGEGAGQITPGQEGTGALEPGLPKADEVAHGGLTKAGLISEAPGLGQTLAPDGASIQYYNKADGRFYRIDSEGQAKILSDQVFYEVQNIYWDPAGEKAILKYPDGANVLYNFSTKGQVTLPSHWEDYNFSPAGDKIVMKSMGLNENNRWLAIANPDGTGAKALEALGENGDQVYPSWSPNKQSVAMFTESTGFDQQKVYFIGLNNENFKALTIEGRGFQHLWSPKGDRLLYSVYSSTTDLKPSLWVTNAQGEAIGSGRKNLNVQTWADKCVFDSDNETAYCAVPDQIEEGAGIYPDMANATPDKLYQINTYTGMKKLLAIPDQSVSMHNLILTENGRNLYFSDPDGKIYKIKLK
jgi:hypothetical protein